MNNDLASGNGRSVVELEKACKKTESQRKAILQTVIDGICIIDLQGRIIEVNDAFCTMSGFTGNELTNKSIFDLETAEMHAGTAANIQTVVRQGKGNFTSRHHRKDGSFFDAEINARYVAAEEYLIVCFRDITVYKHAEEELMKNEALMRTAFENLPLIFYMIDRDGKFKLSIGAGLKGLGLEQNQVVGLSAFEIYKDFPEITQSIHRSLAGETVSFESQVNGSSYLNICVPFSTGNRGFTGIVGVALDISERRRSEESLRNMQRLESLGILAGGIAHDFNNLMGGIFGYIDLANDELDKKKSCSYLSKALATIDRARALTAQLLTFAKGGSPIKQVGNLFPFIMETAQFALSGARVSCRFAVSDDLWTCDFDKNQIGQVIDNIVINAQQAMPVGGTIELHARNVTIGDNEHPALQNGNYVKISIRDFGIGIPKELLPRIFDPFFTTKTKGHGLGLATCYSIINKHGGCIDVESELGKGSTFHVFLPATAQYASFDASIPAKPHKGIGTIIIMDDEEVMRETLRDFLVSVGYTVICKDTGSDAVDAYKNESASKRTVSGLIFDLTVPGGMGGKEAVALIRALNTDVPVFVVSGYAEDPVMKNPAEYGFTASICKPFKKNELVEMLNKYL